MGRRFVMGRACGSFVVEFNWKKQMMFHSVELTLVGAFCICPELSAFAQSVLHLPKAFCICSDLFAFAQSFLHLPKAFCICPELSAFAQSFLHFPRAFCIFPELSAFSQSFLHLLRAFCIFPELSAFAQKLPRKSNKTSPSLQLSLNSSSHSKTSLLKPPLIQNRQDSSEKAKQKKSHSFSSLFDGKAPKKISVNSISNKLKTKKKVRGETCSETFSVI
jgi:hypothetical protein